MTEKEIKRHLSDIACGYRRLARKMSDSDNIGQPYSDMIEAIESAIEYMSALKDVKRSIKANMETDGTAKSDRSVKVQRDAARKECLNIIDNELRSIRRGVKE